MKRTFYLVHDEARRRAIKCVSEAPTGYVVECKEPVRNLDQNALLHAALTKVSDQVVWHGQKLSVDVWKRLCTASWLREEGEHPELIPALDGCGFDVIFEKTSKLSVKQCSSLVEWILSFGSQQGVELTESDGTR